MTVEQLRVRPSDMSDEEWQVRVELAALYRLCVHYGWTDITATHISARIPGNDDQYLLNCFDLMFDEISASTLMRVTWDGEHEDKSRNLNKAGHLIHSAMLQARPDINFVMHTHTRAGMAVAAMPGGLQPLSQHSGFVLGTLATHPYQDVTHAEDECELLAKDMGDNYAMLLENHGFLTVGRTAAEAFFYHYYLEMSCKVQVDVLGATQNPIRITDAALAPLKEMGHPKNGPHGNEEWPALMRMLDRKDPSFRQ